MLIRRWLSEQQQYLDTSSLACIVAVDANVVKCLGRGRLLEEMFFS